MTTVLKFSFFKLLFELDSKRKISNDVIIFEQCTKINYQLIIWIRILLNEVKLLQFEYYAKGGKNISIGPTTTLHEI